MRYPISLLTVIFLSVSIHTVGQPGAAQKSPLAEARQRLQRGNYAEARARYEELGKDAQYASPSAIGIAAAWRMEGETGKALGVLDDAIRIRSNEPVLHSHRADLLYSIGKHDDAMKDADVAITKNRKQFLARWVRARISGDRGDLETADKEIRSIVRDYTEAEEAGRPIVDVEELLIIGQAGTENATINNKPAQFHFVLNEIYRDALKLDPDCWQAENLSGRMLLDKHNRADAAQAFDKALAINPRAVEAIIAKGLLAFVTLDLREAERYAERALAVNPRHPEALQLKGDVALASGDAATAEKLFLAANIINPRDPAALARLAALASLSSKKDNFAERVAEAERFDSRPAKFYHELATVLESRKRYVQAIDCYRKSTELRPTLPVPRAALGMLLMRTGQEAEARKILDDALKSDPFNVRVDNSLKVLKHLASYQTIDTPHYVVRFDPKVDKALGGFLAEYLEEIHIEMKEQFGSEFAGKVQVEVFSSREMFSGRMTALPSLPDAAAGACSGRVISFPSPSAEMGRPVNWGRIVRHELTHAFNMLQTDYRIPHWLTEGLAVRNEGGDPPAAWMAVLRSRFAAGQHLDLDTITQAFVRPRREDDWPLAYLQALLYVQYMTKTYGEKSIGKLLDSYTAGMNTSSALQQALGVEKGEFERGYRRFLEDIRKRGQRAEKVMTLAELEAARKMIPDDPDITARLASEYQRRNQATEAAKLVEIALAKEPGHPVASIVKAKLLNRNKDEMAARKVLEAALAENPDDPRVLLTLGRAYISGKELPRAAELFEKGLKVAPDDSDWLIELAQIYSALHQTEKLIIVLKAIAARDSDEVRARIKLADIFEAAGKLAEAERQSRDILLIDIHNPEAREMLVRLLKAQKKDAEAAKVTARFVE